MTGVEVMYQPYAYPAYFPYQRPFADQKFGVQKMQEPLDSVNYSSSTSVSRNKVEDEQEKESQPKDTQYLNANCVLLTYFSGDISSVVDEHFSRALSQPSSYSADSSGTKSLAWKDSSPMSQRNFPPSFWNSAYQPPSTISSAHHDIQFTPEPYISTSIHGLSGLHHQDPWHYSISSQTHGYPHRSMHDFAYSTMAAPSRYNPHYSSLLMQPSVTAGRLGGCDMTKPSESWSSRYHPDHRLGSDFPSRAHLDSGISGLENPIGEPSKDLYWF